MKKRTQYIAIGIVAIIAIASVSSVVLYMNAPKGGTIIYGVMYGPDFLDAHNSWDSASIDVINQVLEGLVDVDIADPNYPIVPRLATALPSISTDGKEYTFTLRQGVKFHDGTDFNAAAVKWNYDRLYGMIDEVILAELWVWADHTWIIKETVVVDDYTVKLVLNKPYAPMLGLLSCWTAYFMSPASTNKTEIIDTATGDLVGTGPFLYDSYEAEVEVLMTPNPDYWGGKPAFDKLIFSVITDSDARNAALLSGEITHVDSAEPAMISSFEAEPNIAVVPGPPSLSIQYMVINNYAIPPAMRKALSYAFNYTYLIDEIMEGYATRMTSMIPKGVMYHSTEGITLASMDRTIAQQALIDANWPGTTGLTAGDDAAWIAKAESATPLATYNFTYNIGNAVREDLLILIQDNFKYIGVKIEGAGMTWAEFLYRCFHLHGHTRDELHLGWIGWIPDYNDPSNFINMLMTNRSVACNEGNVNDAQMQIWMEEALEETDTVKRAELYHNIQKRCAEEIYPYIYGYVSSIPECYAANYRGYIDNPFKSIFSTCYLV